MGKITIAYREADASLNNFAVLMAKPIQCRPAEPVDIGALTTVRFDKVTFRHRGAHDDAVRNVSFGATRSPLSALRVSASRRW